MTTAHVKPTLAEAEVTPTRTPSAGPQGARFALAAGAAFVVCILAGNGIAGSVTGDDGTTLGDLAAQSASTAARAGLALELVGFTFLLVFVAALGWLTRDRVAGWVAVIGGVVLASVKLGSGGPLLGALHERAALDEASAAGLVAANDASFVLSWLPYGVLLVGTALALHGIGRLGRIAATLGVLLGGATVVFAVTGSVDPDLAVPIPFLLGLLWLAVTSVRLALWTRADPTATLPG